MRCTVMPSNSLFKSVRAIPGSGTVEDSFKLREQYRRTLRLDRSRAHNFFE